jgi:hypothetical protein
MSARVDQINQNSLIISMEEHAARLEKDRAVLDVLSQKIGGGIASVTRMETKWRERRTMAMSAEVGAAGAALNATSVPVDSPSSFHRDEMVFDPASGDMFIVDEDVGGTAVAGAVKVRGKSGTGGITSALAAGAVLLIGPETHAEGEEIPPAFHNVSTDQTTYVFQTDATIKITDILNAEEHYGEPEINQMRADKMTENLERMCLALYNSIGGREIVSASGARRHTPTGLNDYLSGMVTDLNGAAITLDAIGEIIRLTTIYGGGTERKVMIVGQYANKAISNMPSSALRAMSDEQAKWGVRVTNLVTGFGSIPVVYDPLLSAENGMAGELYILDKPSIQQIQLKGLPLIHKTNVQAKRDVHNIEDLYTGTRGLKLKLPELHRRVTGIGA